MVDWEHYRYILAIGRAQTLLGAGQALGVNQTTVGRRLQAAEQAFGARLFNRIEQRLVPTAAGTAAIRRAERMEFEAANAQLEVSGSDESLSGPVRLSSVSLVTNFLLAPRVTDLLDEYPGIELELIDSQRNLDLAAGETDIAIRFARPDIPSAVVSRVGIVDFRVYVARRFLKRAAELPWIAFSESKAALPEARWLTRTMATERLLMRVSDVNVMTSVLSNTPCRALLPSARVTKEMDLVAISGAKPVVQRELWLIYMKALRTNARVAAVAKWAKGVCSSQLTEVAK